MANTKKAKDPTEVALSAIQEALNISEPNADANRNAPPPVDLDMPPPPPPMSSAAPSYSEPPYEPRASAADRPMFEPIEEQQPRVSRRAANDDRETIGQLLQSLQKGRPARSVYTLATIFAGIWLVGCVLLTISFIGSLQAAIGQSGGVLVLGGLAALFFAPIMLFYFLASLAWRGQEMRMIAQAMAQVAIRFSEPEGAASDSMITVGQAIRREVAAMGDGIERAIARAGELETLVANEVAALERAYSDNEVRIRALLQDIAHQRDNLVGQAEQVRSAIS
ncbi:MAG: negative regulator of septation ring formation, partial [Bradyrhizobium icense]